MGFYEHRYIKIRFGICYNFIRSTVSNPLALQLVPNMERLKDLMSQLKEQFDRGADPSQMLRTAQLLEEEIRLLASKPAPAKVMPTKIAVMMPSAVKIVASPLPEEEPVVPAPVEARPARVSVYSQAEAAINGTAINGAAANGAPATNGTPIINGM